jgi:hypothetical protein
MFSAYFILWLKKYSQKSIANFINNCWSKQSKHIYESLSQVLLDGLYHTSNQSKVLSVEFCISLQNAIFIISEKITNNHIK